MIRLCSVYFDPTPRDVKDSIPAWSRDYIFGLGLGFGLTVIGLGLMKH